jgi:transcriptional regulator with XRE-family HTH domain
MPCTVDPVSKLTDRLKEAKGDRSIDDIAAYATKHGHKISRSVVAKYLQDRQSSKPPVKTLDALAVGFGIDPRELRELAGYGRGELGAWRPPAESASLTRDQRDALDRLIKTMVRAEGDSDGRQPDAEKSDDDEGTAGLSWQERRRQRMIEQAQNVAEAADEHPRQADYEVADEDVSQDPDDWGERP